MIRYTIELNGRQYQTTREDKAWDFCLRFGAEIKKQEEADKVIDGIECIERTWEEIWMSVQQLLLSKRGNLEWETSPGSRVVVNPSEEGRYKIYEWPIDGE